MKTLTGTYKNNKPRLKLVFVKLYMFFGHHPLIGFFCWAVAFGLFQGMGLLESISLIIGSIVGLLTIASKIQSFFENTEKTYIRHELRKILQNNKENLPTRTIRRIKELIHETYE